MFLLITFLSFFLNSLNNYKILQEINWNKNQNNLLENFLILTSLNNLNYCLNNKLIIICYYNQIKIIQFHLNKKEITFYSLNNYHNNQNNFSSSLSSDYSNSSSSSNYQSNNYNTYSNNYYLCFSKLNDNQLLLTKNIYEYNDYCKIYIQIKKKFTLDAYLFIQWNQFFKNNQLQNNKYHNKLKDFNICHGINKFLLNNVYSSIFLTQSIYDQNGKFTNLMYWFDRCGNSLTNSKLNLFLVYLWNIDDDLFQENNPNHVYYYKNDGILRRGSIQESCPCIVKKIHCLFNHQILKHSQYEQINCIEDFILYLGSFSITPKTGIYLSKFLLFINRILMLFK